MSRFLRLTQSPLFRPKTFSAKKVLACLLLLAFGIPALGGDGLHLLLHFGSEEHCGHNRENCLTQNVNSAESAENGTQWTADDPHRAHDGSSCFLCQFFSDCHPFAASVPTLAVTENIRVLFGVSDSLIFLNRLFYSSGRSPPQK